MVYTKEEKKLIAATGIGLGVIGLLSPAALLMSYVLTQGVIRAESALTKKPNGLERACMDLEAEGYHRSAKALEYAFYPERAIRNYFK